MINQSKDAVLKESMKYVQRQRFAPNYRHRFQLSTCRGGILKGCGLCILPSVRFRGNISQCPCPEIYSHASQEETKPLCFLLGLLGRVGVLMYGDCRFSLCMPALIFRNMHVFCHCAFTKFTCGVGPQRLNAEYQFPFSFRVLINKLLSFTDKVFNA